MRITPLQNFRLSVEAVWDHRFRSLLTILGIVIGITTVVTVASLLSGVRNSIESFFRELGPNNIFVAKTSGNPAMGGFSDKERRRRPMDPEYVDLIRKWCVWSVEDVALQLFIPPVRDGQSMTARVPGFETDNIFVVAQTANVIVISPRAIARGRFFTPDEELRAMRVAVLGASVAEALFPIGNPIGRPVVVDGAEYIVVGVLARSKLPNADNGFDIQINIPMKTARIRYPQLNNFQLLVNARPGMRDAAFEEVRAAMRRIRKLPAGADDDFAITTPDQIVQQFDRITGLISLAAIAISAIGLLVGGIGVMNIMLVSVTERTREIGVRKALGARRQDIVAQFLVEAMTLTGVGGLLGIVVAVSITFVVGLLVPTIAAGVQGWALGTGLTVSVAIGLFFGVWPAVKASRLDPVEALRHE